MDTTRLLLQQLDEEEEDDAHLQNLRVAGLCIAGVLEMETERIRRRNPSRLYLTRPQLMPNPRVESPWMSLWRGQEDRAFITTMGVDVETFNHILEGRGRFRETWDSTPIPQGDVSSNGTPRLGGRSLDAAGALGLVLHYLSSSMLEIHLQQIFAIVPSVLARYLDFSLDILLRVLRRMEDGRISLPQTKEELEIDSLAIQGRHSMLVGAFGSIDGLSLPVQVSDDVEIENATYNGWKTEHRINNVLAFSPRGAWLIGLVQNKLIIQFIRKVSYCLLHNSSEVAL
ncbi:hypothetical protein PM082_023360 [Marasmius tenuissimus]|nr:hypothetical protein PM082_023360 [Marasmius tenuissimus]